MQSTDGSRSSEGIPSLTSMSYEIHAAPNAQERVARSERRQLFAMSGAILALHVAGWGILIGVVVPGHYGSSAAPIGIGIGLSAYTLGMRHAFDADHIAAIDNVTRSLAAKTGRRSPSVGFFFSLGHSTVVFALALLLATGLRQFLQPMMEDGSLLRHVAAIVGSGVSGVFLIAVALINLFSLLHLLSGQDGSRGPQGVIGRLVSRPLRVVSRGRQMYPIGFLFGLGFDTATEVGLLVIAAGSAAVGLPWYGLLCLPLLFAAGMVLFDSLDGVFVGRAYDWALSSPSRKRSYNAVVTSASVLIAFGVGSVQILSSISEGFSWRGAAQDALDGVDQNALGVGITVVLAVVFIGFAVIHRATQPKRTPIESADASVRQNV